MDMKRLVMMAVAAGAALAAAAMPTKKELQKAQEMVADVTEADVKALKAGTMKPTEVAAKHMDLATQAGSEAEKYLLLQGAFKLYAKAGDYEGAANALGTMNREISDMNPEVIISIYNKAIFSSMKEKAPKLYAIKEAARRLVSYRKLLVKAEAAVKANPKDPAAQKKLGECHAELGNWPKALDAFALAGGDLAKTAKAELDGSLKSQEIGDFWWDYESGDEMSTYKLHAAELYRTALADDSFKGLARTRSEQRVKEVEEVEVDLPSAVRTVGVGTSSFPKFKAGESFEIVLDSKRKVSLGLAACPPGEFEMKGNISSVWGKKDQDRVKEWWGSAHKVQLTYPFLIMKGPLSYAAADVIDEETAKKGRAQFSKGTESIIPDLPVMELSWDDIQVLAARLNKKLKLPSRLKRLEGYEMRLPTEAEWRYAIRAGSDAKDWAAVSDWCKEWGGYWWGRLPKGSYYPFAPLSAMKKSANPWGLFYLGPKTIYADTFDGQGIQYPLHNDMDLCYLRKDIFQYADSETNPVRIHNGEPSAYLTFYGGTMPKLSVKSVTKQRCPFRFVFAPKLSLLNVYPREEAAKAVKVKGGSSIASAKAADAGINQSGNLSNVSVKTPTPKCKMVNGRPAPLKFELAKGVDLELEGCPAGEFDMERGGLKDIKGLYPHRVKISRPFWLGKNRVTIEQYETFKKAARIREKKGPALEVLGGEKCPVMLLSRDEIDQFFRRLNRKYASLIPRGYVFRLPTEAEWEYAHTANSTDPDDPYTYKDGRYVKFCNEHPEKTPGWHWNEIEPLLKAKGIKEDEYTIAPKVGTRLANKWGIQDMNDCGYELMLDTIDRSIDAPKWHWHLLNVDNKCFGYKAFETDPLRQFAGETARSVVWGRFNGSELMRRSWGEPKYEAVSVALRVCLGPDLVAEKKAKGK